MGSMHKQHLLRRHYETKAMFYAEPRQWGGDQIRRTWVVATQVNHGGKEAATIDCLRSFGHSLQDIRRRLGCTRRQVGERGQCPPQEVAFIEWGLMTTAEVEDRLPALARGLNVTYRSLYNLYHTLFASDEQPETMEEL